MAVIPMRLRRAAWSHVFASLLLVACGGDKGHGPPSADARSDETGQDSSVVADVPNSDGPGLQATSTDSLQLPVARTFNLAHVEPRYFALALNKDPDRIFEFVRDHVAFEPYRGCLRGPRGTLLAMAGNSVDRAALLGSLLASAEHQVRYAHGTLDKSKAGELVASIWSARSAAAGNDADKSSPELDTAVDKFMSGTKRDGFLLARSLGAAGIPDKRSPSLTRDTLIGEAQDHYWVEMLKGDQWIAMDPSFAAAKPGDTYAETASTSADLPEELYHRIEMRVRVEESAGGEQSSREVLNYAARAADLSGVDVLLTHEQSQSEDGIEVRPVLLVQQEQVIGLSFWVTVPRGEPSGGLADALSGGSFGGGDSMAAATAQLVQLEFIAPDGRKETVVREIFDRDSSLGIDPEDLPRAVYDFFVTTGALHDEHLKDISAQAGDSTDEDPDVGAELRMISIAFTAIADGLTGRMANSKGRILRVYPDTPRVYVAELSERGGLPRLSLDLRRDEPRVVVSGFERGQLFFAEVLRGVINGTAERQVMGFFGDGDADASAMSTSVIFERADAEKIGSVLLSRTSSALKAGISNDVRARIDESLAKGHLILAPEATIAIGGKPRFAWWQVDPRSGRTIAVTDEGLYQAAAEGVVIRNRDGTFTVQVTRHGGRGVERATARTREEAARYVRNYTRNYAKDNCVVYWDGLVDLWIGI